MNNFIQLSNLARYIITEILVKFIFLLLTYLKIWYKKNKYITISIL